MVCWLIVTMARASSYSTDIDLYIGNISCISWAIRFTLYFDAGVVMFNFLYLIFVIYSIGIFILFLLCSLCDFDL